MILNKEAFNLALAQAELTKQEVAKKERCGSINHYKAFKRKSRNATQNRRENCQGLRLQCNRDHRNGGVKNGKQVLY